MARECLVCNHEDRAKIETALIESTPNRRIGRDYGIPEASVRRHRTLHLLPTLAGARNRREQLAFRAPVNAALAEANRPVDLLFQVDDLYARAKGLLDKAEAAGKFGPAASAIREATRLCELLGRLQGDLTTGSTSTVNVLITSTPEWLSLRAAVFTALTPYPEARAAVGKALRALPASDAVSDDHPEKGV